MEYPGGLQASRSKESPGGRYPVGCLHMPSSDQIPVLVGGVGTADLNATLNPQWQGATSTAPRSERSCPGARQNIERVRHRAACAKRGRANRQGAIASDGPRTRHDLERG